MISSQGSRSAYQFGLFKADAETGELLRKGVRVKLQEQPFRLLILLLENSGEIVTRESVRQRLWPANTFVEFDASLSVAVGKLREALGDDAENPIFIETVPRRGYRFIAPVREIGAPSDPGTTDDNGDRLKIDSLSLTAAVASGAAAPHERDEPIVVMGTSMSTPDVSINGESGIPQVLRTDVRWRWRRAWTSARPRDCW